MHYFPRTPNSNIVGNNDDDDSNDNNEILTTDLISNSTNDPNDPCFSFLDQDDAVLLSIGFSNHSIVLNYIQQYSSSRGFLATHQIKDHFLADEYEKIFPQQSYSGTAENPNSRLARRGFFYCSPKSNGRTKHVPCCFKAYYLWSSKKNSFIFSHKASNHSHNHPLSSLLTVVHG
jgi:hypothetical protein